MKAKYEVKVVWSFWQTFTIEAESEAEARATAYDLFDQTKPMEMGEGEVMECREVQ